MKRYEKKPTEQNVFDTLLKDEIKRNEELFHFLKLLDVLEDGFTIALDSQWGSGKTFFVKQAKMIIDAYNPQTEVDDSIRKKIIGYCDPFFKKEEISTTPRACIYYDAWLHDNDDDPIKSLVYEMIMYTGKLKDHFKNPKIVQPILSIFDSIAKTKLSSIVETLKMDDPLKEIKEQKDLYCLVSEFLDQIIEEWGNNLIIFVDELDRCNPLYAVKLLERIKHYFDNDNITFVFSVNLSELQHTIKSCYGSSFNASQYLNRFFDLTCSLSDIPVDVFARLLSLPVSDVTSTICKHFHFSLRDQAQYFQALNNCGLGSTKRYDSIIGGVIQDYFLPIMVGIRIHNKSDYNDFINGNAFSILETIISELPNPEWTNRLFEDRSVSNYRTDPDFRIDQVLNNFREIYEAVFNLKGFGNDESYTRIKSVIVYRETKGILLKIIGAMYNKELIE